MLTCLKCDQEIKDDKHYIFIDPLQIYRYCVACHDKEMEKMINLDADLAPLWAKNFKEVETK